jgi:hypothetical protein
MSALAAAKAAGAVDPNAFADKDALSAALALEGLLFVSFSMAFALAGSKEGGNHPFFVQGWFGWLVFGAIFCAALAAGASWWGIYGEGDPGGGIGTFLQGAGLAVGIAAQPIFAFILNFQAGD